MGRSHTLAKSKFDHFEPIEPIDGVYHAPQFSVEPISGGLECYGDDFRFTLTVDAETSNYEVDRFGRMVFPDVFNQTDLAITVFRDHLALQKVVKGPDAPTHFVTKVNGEVPDWLDLAESPEAIDNFYGEKAKGRVTYRDIQRDVVQDQWVDGKEVHQTIEHRVYREDPATRLRSITDDVVYPIRLHVNFNLKLDKSSDDALVVGEENNTTLTGAVAFERLGWTGGGEREMGIVFAMTVPQGVTIDDATLTIFNNANANGTPTENIEVWADDDLTQGAFGASDRPSQATKTTASATISGATASTTSGGQIDIDITSVVQEIVNDVGWSSGDDIRFIVESDETTGYQFRSISNANNYTTANQEPELDVNYTSGPSITNVDTDNVVTSTQTTWTINGSNFGDD